jgi:predicted phosphodiesterase
MEGYKPYCTERQIEIINALSINNNNKGKTARYLDISERSLRRTINTIKERAASKGYAPNEDLNHPTPAGQSIKGVSTLYDDEGNIKIQWVKTNQDHQAKEDLREFVDGLCSEIKGKAKKVKITKQKYDPDLMSLIIFGDAHLGMYAWGDETLSMDFDTDIAVQDMRNAIDNMIARAPNAETGVLVDVGDFMHMNNATASTAAGTGVDVDSRYQRVLKAAGMVMRYCIDQMLLKYKKVIVVVAKGNHNPEPAVAVAMMLSFYYDKEPRVNVLDTIGHHHYLTFGDWLIGVNHGDKMKPQKLVSMMARDHKGWSAARFRIWITGHIHHEKVLEVDGCTVASFNTLAPRDAWHASMGYGSRQSSTLITIHKTAGKHSTIEYDLPERKLG